MKPKEYLRLHQTCSLLHQKTKPYTFSISDSQLEWFITTAPKTVLDHYTLTKWNKKLIGLCFMRGLDICRRLISNNQISMDMYHLDIAFFPEQFVYEDDSTYLGSLLHISAVFGHLDLIADLLDAGFDPNLPDHHESRALEYAIYGKHNAICRLLVERGASTGLLERDWGTDVHYAAHFGTPEILALFRHDVNLVYRQETPLHWAAREGPAENVKWLLQNGADPRMRGVNNLSLLDYSTFNDDINVFHYVLEHYQATQSDLEDALTTAAGYGAHDICKKLLDLGTSVNGNPQTNYSPLYASIKPYPIPVFDLILSRNPNLYVGDPHRLCCLTRAAEYGATDMLLKLIQKDPQTVPWSCRSGQYGALHHAVDRLSAEKVRLLLKHGADPNALDEQGRTPMMIASEFHNPEICQLLLYSGSRLDIVDHYGWTCMMHCSSAQNIQGIRWLLRHGMTIPKNIPDRVNEDEQVIGQDILLWIQREMSNLIL
ncbi:ankyrin repeat-containing domain protein [Gorgonomyces haynaldii]|nr:ankyrin repeat-containing domain protein [Gorgonomyces haynaldii]